MFNLSLSKSVFLKWNFKKGLLKKVKPVTIVAFQSGYPKIDTDALAAILEDVDNLPLIIVSMIGGAREGKSFFLNLYMNYLNHLAKVSAM